ncbi:MAG: hypothetical protein ACYDD6_06460, partial [Acidimicrobiales bacterium]
ASLLAPVADRWALALAVMGSVVALVRRERVAGMLAVLGVMSALALVLDPQGKLYNTRFLPLWWLCVYLLSGYFVAELGVAVADWWRRGLVRDLVWSGSPPGDPDRSDRAASDRAARRRRRDPRWPRRRPWAAGAVAVPLVSLAAAGLVVLPPLLVPPTSAFAIGPIHVRADNVPGWAQWNYSGYERKAGWPELHNGIIVTMERVAKRYGCGRAMWEYNADLNRFGTPMALMLLPYWTGNCVDSMEGLLFESASSTPYHFIDQSELSAAPSDAMVGLNYGPVDVALGVQHLQLLGVRYYLASSPALQAQADADPALSLVATTGPWRTPYQGAVLDTTWKVYEVHDASMAVPLTEQPSVLVGTGPQQSSWLPVSQRWFDDPADWNHQLVAGGPASWPRQRAGAASAQGAPLPAAHVTDVRTTSDTVRFHVDRTGVPVLVKVSYFPAWHATGASGPWRAEPNLMVVVPTSHDVTLHYGSTGAGWLGLALTAGGLAAVGMLYRRRKFFMVP